MRWMLLDLLRGKASPKLRGLTMMNLEGVSRPRRPNNAQRMDLRLRKSPKVANGKLVGGPK